MKAYKSLTKEEKKILRTAILARGWYFPVGIALGIFFAKYKYETNFCGWRLLVFSILVFFITLFFIFREFKRLQKFDKDAEKIIKRAN